MAAPAAQQFFVDFGLATAPDKQRRAQAAGLRTLFRLGHDLEAYNAVAEMPDEDIELAVQDIAAERKWTPQEVQSRIDKLKAARDATSAAYRTMSIEQLQGKSIPEFLQERAISLSETSEQAGAPPRPVGAQAKPVPTLRPQQEFSRRHPVWSALLKPLDYIATPDDYVQGFAAGTVDVAGQGRTAMTPEDWAALEKGTAPRRKFGTPIASALSTWQAAQQGAMKGYESAGAHTFEENRPMLFKSLDKIISHYSDQATLEAARRFGPSEVLPPEQVAQLADSTDEDLEFYVRANLLGPATKLAKQQEAEAIAADPTFVPLTKEEWRDWADRQLVADINKLRDERARLISIRDPLYTAAIENDEAATTLKHPLMAQFGAEMLGGLAGGKFLSALKSAPTTIKLAQMLGKSRAIGTLREVGGQVARRLPGDLFYNKAATVQAIENTPVTTPSPAITSHIQRDVAAAEEQVVAPLVEQATEAQKFSGKAKRDVEQARVQFGKTEGQIKPAEARVAELYGEQTRLAKALAPLQKSNPTLLATVEERTKELQALEQRHAMAQKTVQDAQQMRDAALAKRDKLAEILRQKANEVMDVELDTPQGAAWFPAAGYEDGLDVARAARETKRKEYAALEPQLKQAQDEFLAAGKTLAAAKKELQAAAQVYKPAAAQHPVLVAQAESLAREAQALEQKAELVSPALKAARQARASVRQQATEQADALLSAEERARQGRKVGKRGGFDVDAPEVALAEGSAVFAPEAPIGLTPGQRVAGQLSTKQTKDVHVILTEGPASVPELMRYATDKGRVAAESVARQGMSAELAASPRVKEYLKDLFGFATPEMDLLHAAVNEAHPNHAAAKAAVEANPKLQAAAAKYKGVTDEMYELGAQHGLMNYIDDDGVLRQREPVKAWAPLKTLTKDAQDKMLKEFEAVGLPPSFDAARQALRDGTHADKIAKLDPKTREFLSLTDFDEGEPLAIGQVKARTGSELGRTGKDLPWETDVRKQMQAEMRKRPEAVARAAELRALQEAELIQVVRKNEPGPKGIDLWETVKTNSDLGKELFRILGKEGDKLADIDHIRVPRAVMDRLEEIMPRGRRSAFSKYKDTHRSAQVVYDVLRGVGRALNTVTTVFKLTNTNLSGAPGNAFQLANLMGAGQLDYLANGVEAADPRRLALTAKAGLLARGLGSQALKDTPVLLRTGETVRLDDIVKAGLEDGALGQGVLKYGAEHTARDKVSRVLQGAAKYSGNQITNDLIEDYQHGVHYLRAIQKYGLTPPGRAKAMAEVARYSGLYRRLSPFERTYMRAAVPFYAWQRVYIPIVAKTLAQHPERIQDFQRLVEAADRASAGEVEAQFRQPMDSTGISARWPFPTPIRAPMGYQPNPQAETTQAGARTVFRVQTPLDAFSVLNPNFLPNMPNPLISYMYSLYTGKDWYSGGRQTAKQAGEQLGEKVVGKGGAAIHELIKALTDDGYDLEAQEMKIRFLIGNATGPLGKAAKAVWPDGPLKGALFAPGLMPGEVMPTAAQAQHLREFQEDLPSVLDVEPVE